MPNVQLENYCSDLASEMLLSIRIHIIWDKSDSWKNRILWKLLEATLEMEWWLLWGREEEKYFWNVLLTRAKEGCYTGSLVSSFQYWRPTAAGRRGNRELGHSNCSILSGNCEVGLTPLIPFGQWLPSIWHFRWELAFLPFLFQEQEERTSTWHLVSGSPNKQVHICGFQWQAFLLPTWKDETSSDPEKADNRKRLLYQMLFRWKARIHLHIQQGMHELSGKRCADRHSLPRLLNMLEHILKNSLEPKSWPFMSFEAF